MKKILCFIMSCLLVCTVCLFAGCNNGYENYQEALDANRDNSSSGGSGGGVSDELLMYLSISVTDVTVTHNSLYTVCTGKVKNTNSSYSFRYIKVQGKFKNYSGTVVDTDWNYAVGSEWLGPGESASFRLSVPLDRTIKSCSVEVLI